MYREVLFFLLIVIPISLSGNPKTKSFRTGINLNTIKIKDLAASSLQQQNTLAGFSFAFRLHSDKSYENISINRISGKLHNKESFISTKINLANIDWIKTWNIINYKTIPLGIGFNLHSEQAFTTRDEFSNNTSYNTFFHSLSPTFRIEKQILNPKQKPIDFSFMASGLIFSYIIRPSLTTAFPISYSGELAETSDDYYTSGRFVSLNKLQYFKTSTSIDFHPWKKFLFSIGYNWSFMNYNTEPVYYEINHEVFLHVGIQF